MIHYNFDRIFKARGINKPFSFLKQAGFSDNFSVKVNTNRVRRIGLKELEKLCLLLHCTPNDFMEWIPDEKSEVNKEHPINAIRRPEKLFNITKTLYSVPLNKLDEIEQLINDKIQKKD